MTNLALDASAGSGKTFNLSARFVSLLFMGVHPSAIVALTFTKKAAFEMKERIFNILHDLHLEEKKAQREFISEQTGLSEEAILSKQEEILSAFLSSHLNISTMDAFFGKILRKFSLNLSVMPNYQNAKEKDKKEFRNHFLSLLLNKETLLNYMIDFMLESDKKFDDIFEIFESLYKENVSLNSCKENMPNPTLDEISKTCQELKNELAMLNAPPRAINLFNKHIDADYLVKENLKSHSYTAKYATPKNEELYAKLKEQILTYMLEKEKYTLSRYAELFKLYKLAKKHFIQSQNVLSFDDVSLYTHELLQSIDKDFLYFRLDEQIKHLLIDEFQDTNVVQYDILRPIIEEITSSDDGRSFFYVGDIKQAIYRFRGGSSELFDIVAKKHGIAKASLDTNYRSDRAIVDFVNATFDPLYPEYTKQKIKQNAKEGYVHVDFIQTLDDKEVLLQGILNELNKLLSKGVKADDIAILCHTAKDANSIKNTIKQYDNNLLVSLDAKMKLIKSRQVLILIEYLKYSYFHEQFRHNDKNVLALLGMDITQNFKDVFPILTHLERPIIELCVQAIDILALNWHDKDLLYFLELVSKYKSLEELVFHVDNLEEESQNSDLLGVKILTIHKSKGLAFHSVIIADRIHKEQSDTSKLLYSYKDGRIENIFYKMEKRELLDENYKSAAKRKKIFKIKDSINLYYVACTRAKANLSIILKSKSSALECLKLQALQNGQIAPSVHVGEKKSKAIFEQVANFGRQQDIIRQENDSQYDIEAINFGLALHYLLEISCDFSLDSLQKAKFSLDNRYGLLVDCDEVLRRAGALILNEEFQNLLKGAKIHKEISYMQESKRRQIDLLLEFDDKMIIIDYKSTDKEETAYKKQVLEYMSAVEKFSHKKTCGFVAYLGKESFKLAKVQDSSIK